MARPAAACLMVAVAVVLAGCAGAEEARQQRRAEAIDDGVQLTGRLGGARVAISDGSPETGIGDCDPGDGPDEDVCWVARSIDGLTVALVVENPAALTAGEPLEVRDDDCTGCDDVTEHAVVDLRVAGESRRVPRGRLDVREAGPRWAADIRLELPDGDELTGSFNIRRLEPDEL
jgi:hypothetical protein